MKTTTEPQLEELLQEKGYTIIRKLGEGHTRDVYEVEYNNGSLQKRRVLKVPKIDIDESSITTRINLSKGDLDEREVLALNKVSHPNVVEIHDAFKIDDRTLTVEEHYDAISLEELVKISGPITDPERFKEIFSQVRAGLEHLHEKEKLLHRDIKPSNILVGKQGTVKLTDLQTAGKIDEISPSFLPTRGGTQFTAPYLINALLNGQETNASLQSEFYALGATMYYALTGEPLFNIELVPDENGKPIAGIKASLKLDGRRIEGININEHDRLLRKRLEKVPKQYRNLLLHCLNVKKEEYIGPWVAHARFKTDLEKATNSKLLPSLRQHAKWYTGIAAVLTGLIGGIGGIFIQDQEAKLREPSIYDILKPSPFSNDGGLEFLLGNEPALEKLIPYYEEIRTKIGKVENSDLLAGRNPIEVAADILRMSRRMGYSLIRSILMEDEQIKQTEYGDERHNIALLPKDYADKILDGGKIRDEYQETFLAIRYLRHCMPVNSSIPDVFANYFCNPQEIFEARKKANNFDYFPKDGTGYAEYLPPIKRNLINRALALYYITDNEGKVHLEVLDDNNKPIKGLEAK